MIKSIKGSVLWVCFFWLSFVHAQNLETALPEDVGMSTERLERFSTILEQYVKDGKMAGNVALIARKGKIIYHRAFGDSDIGAGKDMTKDRSEEHTSELQSREKLVCRLLLEKKNQKDVKSGT